MVCVLHAFPESVMAKLGVKILQIYLERKVGCTKCMKLFFFFFRREVLTRLKMLALALPIIWPPIFIDLTR